MSTSRTPFFPATTKWRAILVAAAIAIAGAGFYLGHQLDILQERLTDKMEVDCPNDPKMAAAECRRAIDTARRVQKEMPWGFAIIGAWHTPFLILGPILCASWAVRRTGRAWRERSA